MLQNIDRLIIVGDKILIRPEDQQGKTASGLYLPPGVNEKEKVHSGYVIKVGPGYPLAVPVDEEPWMERKDPVKYIPLQVKEGDFAIFMKKEAIEVEYEREKLLIVPQTAILMLERNDILDQID